VATANAAACGKAGASCDAGRAAADGSATSKTTDASAPAQSSPADKITPPTAPIPSALRLDDAPARSAPHVVPVASGASADAAAPRGDSSAPEAAAADDGNLDECDEERCDDD
jgi:hypothetical protein